MNQPRYWLSRLILSCWAFSIGLTTSLDAHSVAGPALRDTSVLGWVFPPILLTLSCIAIVDCLVNDVLPTRFRLLTKHYRHLGFPAMGIVLCVMCAVVAVRLGMRPLLTNYFLPCLFAFALTFLDIFQRRSAPR